MVSYRGIDKRDLLDSLKQAKTFLTIVAPGPTTESWLEEKFGDERVDDSPLRLIDQAQDDLTLAQVMKDTQIRSALYHFNDFFAYYAMTAMAYSYSCESGDLYGKLAVWGAFQNRPEDEDGRLAGLNVAAEVDGYLAAEACRLLQTQKADYGTSQIFADEAVNNRGTVRQDFFRNEIDEAILQFMRAADRLLPALTVDGYFSEIKEIVRQRPMPQRLFLKEYLCRMTGLAPYRDRVASVTGPIKTYAVIMERPPLREEERLTLGTQIRTRLHALLDSFIELDEAILLPPGIIPVAAIQSYGQGVGYFFGTARCARYVAHAIGNHTVMEYDGKNPPRIIPPPRFLGGPSAPGPV